MNPPNSVDKLRTPPRHPRSIFRYIPLALLALAILLFALYFSQLTLLRYHAYESLSLIHI